INSAAHRMYYDRDRGGWPVDLYQAVGVEDVFAKLPEQVLDLGVQVGELTVAAAEDLGLVPGVPVAEGGIDAWTGQVGLNALRPRSEEHTSELQSRFDLVCRLLLEKKKGRDMRLPEAYLAKTETQR